MTEDADKGYYRCEERRYLQRVAYIALNLPVIILVLGKILGDTVADTSCRKALQHRVKVIQLPQYRHAGRPDNARHHFRADKPRAHPHESTDSVEAEDLYDARLRDSFKKCLDLTHPQSWSSSLVHLLVVLLVLAAGHTVHPLLVVQIPAHRLLYPLLELQARLPAKLPLELA